MDGVSSKLIKFELMKSQVEMSLEKCIEIGRTVEAALLHANGSSESTENIFFYQQRIRNTGTRPKHKQNNNSKQHSIKCFCCGKENHVKADCRLIKKFCSECGQQGHIYKMCSKKRQISTLEAKQPEEDAEEPEENVIQNSFQEEYKTYSVSVSRVPPHYITLNICGFDLKFLLDTGSDVTVMSINDKNLYFNSLIIQDSNVLFRNFDQSITKPLGILTNLSVKYNEVTKILNIFVVKDNAPRVIGRDWLNELNLWPPNLSNNFEIGTNLIQNVSDAQQLVKSEFAEVFSPGLGNFKGETISLKLKPDAKPRCLPVRRVPFALREKVNNEITRLLNNGRITEVEQSEWGTPVVPILKPDGSVRLCGDYKLTVNPCLEIDHFPLPHVDDILDTLKQGEYYCELDLKEAYLQAPLSSESKNCTTIVTEAGTFKYNYLPYGVSSGPGAFQRLMMRKLKNIPNTIVFIDNIYIKGKDVQDTYETLCQVLKKLQDSEFKLKLEKCKLFTTSLAVFGFHVNKNGISVIKSNIEPLLNAKTPTNLTLLKSFLGKINYYARFLKNMATVLTPLYECTQKNNFSWTLECEKAFQIIKRKLASAGNLRHYDPTLALILTCDASDTGLGAVLSNRDENGVVKPIAFASKKLNKVEQKYATIDKEALAVVFGITKFYNYIYGRYFELETDNAALVRIFGPTKSIPKMAAKRLQHYAIFLSAFNYKVRHIKSSENPADFLSRIVENENEKLEIHSLCATANSSIVCYTNESQMDTLNWKKIQIESKKDRVFSKVIRYLTDGWPEKKELDSEILPLYNRKTELTLDRGCIFWGYRILVPQPIRKAVLTELHKSHFGIVRMKEIARSYFWWPSLDVDIDNITKECLICLQNCKSPPQTQKPWPIPPSPWYRIHADFLGPFYNKMFLVVVDSFSKWPEVYEMSNITSNRTIDVFKSLFTRFGYPVHLVTDNGRTFTSQEFFNFCKSNQIKHTFTPPYHPATNGAAERFVETFKSAITKIRESGHSLVSAVNLFLFDYSSTPQHTTGVSPSRLMLGREIRNRFSLLRPPPISDIVQEKVGKREEGNRQLKFELGQKVMVRDYRKGGKPWVQGLIVEDSIPGVSYIIDVEGVKWKRHVNQMMACSQSLEYVQAVD
ncbi:Transposon Ty3-G Gag-Pol polyprotein [Papilio machaon]|uniref:RNA-directed DNA polymerase n=1 Tax=Papilio machaon TaxID=76193 RepID=A0A0N0PC64_PAPMA|nr:Transposon Ty3-G Gag-Pol polyprotein [Papilio machaon]